MVYTPGSAEPRSLDVAEGVVYSLPFAGFICIQSAVAAARGAQGGYRRTRSATMFVANNRLTGSADRRTIPRCFSGAAQFHFMTDVTSQTVTSSCFRSPFRVTDRWQSNSERLECLAAARLLEISATALLTKKVRPALVLSTSRWSQPVLIPRY